MSDQFANYGKNRPACAMRHVALSGSATLATMCDAVQCESAGTITITDEAGTALPYAMTAGQIYDFRFRTYSVGSGTFRAWYL